MTDYSSVKAKEKKRRDDFSSQIKEILAERVGFHCSYPGCPMITSGPKTDPSGSINLGVAAHITAAAPGGPRYDPSLTPEERASGDNGIWLCLTHSVLIDRDIAEDGVTPYTADLLRQWKRDAEAAARARLEGKSTTPADKPQPTHVDPATIQIDPDSPPVAAIRELLDAVFFDAPDELHRLCLQDRLFRPVVKQFGSNHGLDDMIDKLISFCFQYILWNDLLVMVAGKNQAQFDRFAPKLRA